MACPHKYIEDLDLSKEEKERLNELHSKIYQEAKDSKIFRLEDGKLYAYQKIGGLNKATAFVAKLREQYGTKVAAMVKVPPNKMKLAINVEKLVLPKQAELPFEHIEAVPEKDLIGVTKPVEGDQGKVIEELLETGAIDKAAAELYKKMLSLSDEEVNNKLKECA